MGGLSFTGRNPTATYECLTCASEWRGQVGPTECPSCGGLYLDWLNYVHPEEFLGARPESCPKIMPNSDIYLRSEVATNPISRGFWRTK